MKTWRVGLVGTGYWSEKHLDAWRRIPEVEIAALCDLSPTALQRRADQYDVPESHCYGALAEMLAAADIDIVDIVTGPDTHPELVAAAAAAGKHIMCQKPFARSAEEARGMVEAAQAAGVRLMVTENWRWLQPFQTIKGVLEEGRLGRVRTARYLHTDYYTPRMTPGTELPQPVFRTMPQLLFYEMGVHWYDTWRYLFGTPKRVYAEMQRISPHIQGEDTGTVMMGYDNGFYGLLDASWATRRNLSKPPGPGVRENHVEQLAIDGEDGTLKLYADGRITIVSRDGLTEATVLETTTLDHGESHYRLQRHFVSCLASGAPFQTGGEDNLITLQMVEAAYTSAREHRPVAIEVPEAGAES
ncbi:Gfo/Idh/MocA family protein [Paenibacillus sp. 1P07SE]|uniref:Gfo/Idh/MocA family protein n=1 Tax=Paenibacillus sp. 1P07SE TaxID=3132209 RepID=UPI0039A473CD